MSYAVIKKATILSVVVFCVFLVVASIQYAFSEKVSLYVYKLTGLSVAFAITFGVHFWSTSYQNAIGFQRAFLSILNVEIIFTLLTIITLVFNWFDFNKTIVIFCAFQLVHGAVYLCNMFLYDEKPMHKRTLSDQEIVEKSNKKSINPAIQESNGVDGDSN